MDTRLYELLKRLFTFLLITVFCFSVAAIVAFVVLRVNGGTAGMRLSTFAQDVLMFIAPSLAIGWLFSKGRPWAYLSMNRLPTAKSAFMGTAAFVALLPILNVIIEWNAGLKLPPSLGGLEAWMRQSEDAASGAVELMLGGNTVADLIINILLIGVLAGFSEELFFRGALQGILAGETRKEWRRHAAVWLSAFVFSGIHFQFYGFVPRLLLGAYFGYMLLWTGSLWLPVFLHALNNSVVVIAQWRDPSGGVNDTTSMPEWMASTPMVIFWTVVGILLLFCMVKESRVSRTSCE